ncbi:TonB-dependent receptor [Chitinophaga lutea]
MKLTILLLTAVFLQTAQAAYSQRVTIEANFSTLRSVLASIKKQTGYRFLYSNEMLEKAVPVTLSLKNAPAAQALAELFRDQPLTYRVEEGTILISLKPPTYFGLPAEALKEMTLTGTVSNEKGEPIPGAAIIEKGTGNGVVSDAGGQYSIRLRSDTATIIIRSMGFATQELRVSGPVLHIVLKEDNAALSEVVVVGYGQQKKANLTGAVSSVNMEEVLGNRPVSGTAQALQGAVPGLQITYGTGQPGSGTSVNIRGFTSINGGSPLILVDNVPMNIDDVNPRDIENISVLKDAAAASIYGARAAFGVVLITTKKGRKNQPVRFNYSNNFTWSSPISLPEKASPLEMVKALKDFGSVTYWSGQNVNTWLGLLEEYNADPSKYPEGITKVTGLNYPLAEHDMYNELFTGGFEQMHNLSFGGGSDKTTYRVSAGVTAEDGIMVTDKDRYRRYNFNAYLSTELAKNLTASVNVFYKNETRFSPSVFGDLFYNAITYPSYADPGSTTINGVTLPYNTPNNVVKVEPANKEYRDNIRLFGKLEYQPVKDLVITGEYTLNRNNANAMNVTAKNEYFNAMTYDRQFQNANTRYTRGNGQLQYHALNVYAKYKKDFGQHHLQALVGTNQEISKRDTVGVYRLDLMSAQVPALSTSKGTVDAADIFEEYAISGYFGRINYDYKGRYLLELNGRFDGSSRFPPGHRFGFFPSVSAGWNVSEESFMQQLKDVLPQFKLRGSYGSIGNQVIDNRVMFGLPINGFYAYIPSMAPGNSGWIDPATNIRLLTISPPALVSSSFTWETVRTLNFGVDLGLLKNKLAVNFDIFSRKTLNMLAPGAELPQVLGAAAPLQNVADLETKGWELEVSYKDNVGDFNYGLGFNLSDNQSRITKFNNPVGLLSQYYEGQRLGEIWGYVTQGYFTTEDFAAGTLNPNLTGGTLKGGIAPYRGVPQNPGDIRYQDLNGDGVIFNGNGTLKDPGDTKVIGNNTRRFQFGVFGNASWKNFELSFFLQGVGKRDLWMSNQLFWPYFNRFGTLYKHNLDYWMPNRTDGYYPRIYPDGGGNTSYSQMVQTRYLQNGAYLRVKNVTLGYAVPKKWLNRIHVDNARIFASGENIFTFTSLPKGTESDATNYGEGGIYPFLKKYSVGVNISF